jgi:hypothetical protein
MKYTRRKSLIINGFKVNSTAFGLPDYEHVVRNDGLISRSQWSEWIVVGPPAFSSHRELFFSFYRHFQNGSDSHLALFGIPFS